MTVWNIHTVISDLTLNGAGSTTITGMVDGGGAGECPRAPPAGRLIQNGPGLLKFTAAAFLRGHDRLRTAAPLSLGMTGATSAAASISTAPLLQVGTRRPRSPAARWPPARWASAPAHPPLIDPSDARDNVGNYDDYPELYVRWFEYGAFQPNFRTHGTRNHNEVWSYGKQAEPILEKYLRLRYQLMPYIYSLAWQTHETGAPFMRGLFLDFPGDPNVANIGDEYMFGPALLVAPVTDQGATERSVYLPAGSDWFNFWTNERVHGGQRILVPARSTPFQSSCARDLFFRSAHPSRTPMRNKPSRRSAFIPAPMRTLCCTPTMGPRMPTKKAYTISRTSIGTKPVDD